MILHFFYWIKRGQAKKKKEKRKEKIRKRTKKKEDKTKNVNWKEGYYDGKVIVVVKEENPKSGGMSKERSEEREREKWIVEMEIKGFSQDGLGQKRLYLFIYRSSRSL